MSLNVLVQIVFATKPSFVSISSGRQIRGSSLFVLWVGSVFLIDWYQLFCYQ